MSFGKRITQAVYCESEKLVENYFHVVCKPAYLVPVQSQDEFGGLCQEGHTA